MNYQKIYNDIIYKRHIHPISMDICYCEKHHIVPKCMSGTNDVENLVNLTAREHYICHVLLSKIYKNTEYEHDLLCAIIRTLQENGKKNRNLKYNSRFVGHLKERKAYVCSRKFTYDGKTMTLREWSRYTGINYNTLRNRILVMSFEKAISAQRLINKLYDINGEKHTIKEWADIYNTNYFLVKDRMSKGMTLRQALYPKKQIKTVLYMGKRYTLSELSKYLNIDRELLYRRVKQYGYDFYKHLGLKKGIYLYEGKEYTMEQLQKLYKLPKKIIQQRIYRNVPLTLKYFKRTKVEYKGKMYYVSDLQKLFDISRIRFTQLYDQGYSAEEIEKINIEDKNKLLHFYNGKYYTIKELSYTYNLKPNTVKSRLKNNIPLELPLHSISRKKKEYNVKKVQQFTKDMKPLKIYNSTKDAALSVGADRRNLNYAILHHSSTCKGFRWRYVD